ncbi:MAG: helix-hairpin-helix domain-containing protein [Chloroflexi bacterium]|nr:MAG: helix-hairpin-helix domain-containing protein [Chloroflexota bacterium]
MDDVTTETNENASEMRSKRVNYTYGMVLGVDDFRQEQDHAEWHHQQHNQLLHGYGTVSGLHVEEYFDEAEDDLSQIRVTKGFAVSPRGETIWVNKDLCASLNDWTKGKSLNADENGNYEIYVKLCYKEKPTDDKPVAGQACAPITDSQKPSRIQESYLVELSTERPDQLGEATIRYFGELLGRINVKPKPRLFPGPFPGPIDLPELPGINPPDIPTQPGFRGTPVSPTQPDRELQLFKDDSNALIKLVEKLPGEQPSLDEKSFVLFEKNACDIVQTLLTIWTTKISPQLVPNEGDENKKCLLLACIQFKLDASGEIEEGSLTIDNCDRPILVPSRLQQELFCLTQKVAEHGHLRGLTDDDHPQYLLASGDRPLKGDWSADDNQIKDLGTAEDPGDAVRFDQLRMSNLKDVNAAAPDDGQILRFQKGDDTDNGEWVTETLSAAITNHSELNGLDNDDHKQYLHENGSRPLTANWSVGGHQIKDVGTAVADGDAVRFDQLRISNLKEVSDAAPAGGEILRFRSGSWVVEPMPDSSTGSFVHAPAGDYAIVAAGHFKADGEKVANTYNDLEAEQFDEGRYRLKFSLFNALGFEGITYIVKGTIVDEALATYIDQPFEYPYIAPPVFQVVKFSHTGNEKTDGIEVMITQPILRFERLADILNGGPVNDDWNLITPLPISRSFMVEISAFGEGLAGKLDQRVDINTATEEELSSLPGIGVALARNIIAYRERIGSFTAVSQLQAVPRITNSIVNQLAHLVRV